MDPSKLESQVVRRSNVNGDQTKVASPELYNGPSVVTPESNLKKIQKSANDGLKQIAHSCCSIKFLKNRLPFLYWLPKYNTEDLVGDVIAGITVALANIPQCIAYSLLADLPPIYGMYCSFIGLFIYAVFGTSKIVSVGPCAVTSLLALDYARGNPMMATFLAFISGCALLIASFFNLGFILSFVSKPVFSGFVSGASIAIIGSQLKLLLGLKIKPKTTLEAFSQTASHLGETKMNDCILGVVCMVLLIVFKEIKDMDRFKEKDGDSNRQKKIKRAIFVLSVSSNAIVVICCTVIALVMDESHPFTITGEIAEGLPVFKMIPFSLNNGTITLNDMVSQVGIGVVLMPLITVVEAVAIVNAFADGKSVAVTQEMFTIGLCNVAGAFLQGYPITASFSRSAINASSGVRTQGSGILVGVLTILALVTLTPYFKFIPLPTLGAVVIVSVAYMIEYKEILQVWKVRKIDEIGLWATFLVCIFWKLQYGIVIGMTVNLCVLLFGLIDPKMETIAVLDEFNVPPHVIVQPGGELQYISIDKLRNKIRKVGQVLANGVHPVVLDCFHLSRIDFSVCLGLTDMCKDFKIRGQPLYFINANKNVESALKSLSPIIQVVSGEEIMDTLFKISQREDGVLQEKFTVLT